MKVFIRALLTHVSFYDDCIVIVYTDACIIFSMQDAAIDTLIHNLSQRFLLEEQGSIHDDLGIHIQKDPITKSICMTQSGLIESVLADLNLVGDLKTKDTPSVGVLHLDRNVIPRQDPWIFALVSENSIILLRTPDQTSVFVVHQCACHSANPIALHDWH